MTIYFIDCEFYEDGSTIDLISLALVADDGREFYAVSTDAKLRRVSPWIKNNVLPHLPPRDVNPAYDSMDRFHASQAWRNRKRIKEDVLAFIRAGASKPVFWGYYADYDWVCFCQLFGTMMDLPSGFPMYCRDLKQWCDMLGNPNLPEQSSTEHIALHDARWNKQAYDYLANYYQP